MRKGLLAIVPLLAVLVLSPVAVAEKVFDPPWELPVPDERGTYQAWEFESGELIAYPEVLENPWGEPFIEIENGDLWGTEPGLDGSYTCWHVGEPSGIHHVQIHNYPHDGIRKEVFVQVTSTMAPTVTAPSHPDAGVTSPYPHAQHGGGWYTYNYLVTIPGNPPMDYIDLEFPFCTWVEEIVIHTRCVPIPEPSVMAILGLAGLLFLRKRKK
jgi:hypothetical protein